MAETKTISELIDNLGKARTDLGLEDQGQSLTGLPGIIGGTINGVIAIIDEIASKVGIEPKDDEYAKLAIIEKLTMINDMIEPKE